MTIKKKINKYSKSRNVNNSNKSRNVNNSINLVNLEM